MEQITTPTASDLLSALMPTRNYWRSMAERFNDLDGSVEAIVQQPMFQHVYGSVHGADLTGMLEDVRSGAALLASRLFHTSELEVFIEMGLTSHLNNGLALAARYLRPRAATIPTEVFVSTARMKSFTFILKLVGEDLKVPRPVLQALVERLELDQASQMSLLQATLANVVNQSSKIVLH